MEGKVSPETLKNGKVLCHLKMRFLEDIGDQGAMMALLSCLRDSQVWVPFQVHMAQEDVEQFKNSSVGDVVTTQEEVRLKPDTLRDRNGALYFPVFSQKEQIPQEYAAQFTLMSIPALRALSMAHELEGVVGLVLDGFTQSLPIPLQTADLMWDIPSRLESAQGENGAEEGSGPSAKPGESTP